MKTRILSLFLALLFPLPLCTSCAPTEPATSDTEGMTLAKDGKSDYRIVIPADDIEYRKVAKELQKYFAEISGAELEICTEETEASGKEFILGNARDNEEKTDLEALGEEGFCVRPDGENIRIIGDVRGTLYGVYEFLEQQLDCRFLGKETSILPKQSEVKIAPFEENLQTPGFSWRRHSHTYTNQEPMRTNCTWGSADHYIGGDYTYAKGQVCHTFGPLLGWSKTQSYHKQPCLTDEEVYEKMLATARTWMAEDPDVEIISISQNDAAIQDTGECKCENCVASNELYGASGTLLNFVNRIANELKKDYPNVMVETLAYIHTDEVPKGGVVPADNVIIRFCTMAGCIQHSLEDEDRTADGIYPSNTVRHYENLTAWSKIAKNLYIWEYDINFGSIFTTIPNFERLYENVNLYYRLGVDGVFIQGMGECGEYDHLRAYLCSKLLWNPAMSYEEYQALMSDFMYVYYGDGAADILECIDYTKGLLDHLHPSMYHDLTRYWPFVKDEEGKVDRTHCDKMMEYMENAYKNARTIRLKRRVERAMLPYLYYKSAVICMDVVNKNAQLSELIEVNERIYEIMQRENLKSYREGFTIPANPNLKNTVMYWSLGGEAIFNTTTENAYLKSQNQ